MCMDRAKRRLDRKCTTDTDLRVRDVGAVAKAAAKIALKGGTLSPTRYEAGWVPYCDAPVSIHREQRSSSTTRGLEVDFLAPCRQCQKCLEVRARLWRNRISHEIAQAQQSWFLTLTFDDNMLAHCRLAATADRRARSETHALERAAYRWVQRYLKRLRKNNQWRFRYFAVAEYGETTGRLHFHLIVHEVEGRFTTRRFENYVSEGRSIRLWPAFLSVRLVRSTGLAAYATKHYLTKSAQTLHASARYGAYIAKPCNGRGGC